MNNVNKLVVRIIKTMFYFIKHNKIKMFVQIICPMCLTIHIIELYEWLEFYSNHFSCYYLINYFANKRFKRFKTNDLKFMSLSVSYYMIKRWLDDYRPHRLILHVYKQFLISRYKKIVFLTLDISKH